MNTIVRFICMLWKSFVQHLPWFNRALKDVSQSPLFGNGAGKPQKLEAADFRRTMIVGFTLAGRLCRCDIVPYREEDGGYSCAILQPIGSPSLSAGILQQIAEWVAGDYFHRSPDSVGWMYISYQVMKKTVTTDNVWQICFVRRGAEGELQAAWSEATSEITSIWVGRIAHAVDFGMHVAVR